MKGCTFPGVFFPGKSAVSLKDMNIWISHDVSVVASPIMKVGLALNWDKNCSQNMSLTSMNLCVENPFSEVQSAE